MHTAPLPHPTPLPLGPECIHLICVCTVNSRAVICYSSFHTHGTIYTLGHTPAKSSCKMGTLAAEVVEVFKALVHCG